MFDWDRLAVFIARRKALLQAGERLYAVRRKLATAAMSLLVVMLAYHVVFGVNGMMAYQRKRGQNHKLQQDILRLQQENDRVSRRVRELKINPKAIEREAREQLKYARSGEVVYVTPDPPQSSATAQRR